VLIKKKSKNSGWQTGKKQVTKRGRLAGPLRSINKTEKCLRWRETKTGDDTQKFKEKGLEERKSKKRGEKREDHIATVQKLKPERWGKTKKTPVGNNAPGDDQPRGKKGERTGRWVVVHEGNIVRGKK